MSRLTTAQVIAQGHYLDPDFNPASLTVSQLLGVFGYHNIQYPTPYNKPTLVKLFNDEIKAKAKKFKRERVKKDNSFASDDGITDGVTGQPLNGGRAAPQPRRSSRRLSRQPSEESEQLVALPDPPKRRRSAQPAAAPSKRAAPQPILIEESEPEDEVEEAPPRKIGRRKKNDGDDESEYEQGEEYEDVEVPIKGEEDDDNDKVNAVAQRISEGPRRKLSPPKLQAEEVAPPSPIRRLFLTVILLALGYFTWSYKQESAKIGFCTFEHNGEPMNEFLLELRQHRAEIEEQCHIEQQKHLEQMNGTADANSTPFFGNSTVCAQAALLPVPDACTPCPAHANCTRTTLDCNLKYELKPNRLLFFAPPHNRVNLEGGWLDIWRLLDGFPGLGPVAFPPRCVDDGKWTEGTLRTAKRLSALLRGLRSKRLCSGQFERYSVEDGGEARQWGLTRDEIYNIFDKMTGNKPNKDDVEYAFNDALRQLSKLELIFEGRDTSGQRYYAHKEVQLGWKCWAKVNIRETWAYYRLYVFGIVASTLFAWYKLYSLRAQKIDTERARDLAMEVLETLQNQVITHYSDPVRAPEPYVGSARMRDLLLQREWNNSYRNKIWRRVEKLVEGNENVRANLAEEGGGDEMRVWQWVGSVGMTPMRPRRNSNPFAPDYDEGEDLVAQ
uniref:Man1/Src1 C-terminal domain-containing protein n=1 Tax=Schizophyllum commune (strain H4-8 / FGSC 9210) TaxID=578458 RepID=D8PVI6_SCHCM